MLGDLLANESVLKNLKSKECSKEKLTLQQLDFQQMNGIKDTLDVYASKLKPHMSICLVHVDILSKKQSFSNQYGRFCLWPGHKGTVRKGSTALREVPIENRASIFESMKIIFPSHGKICNNCRRSEDYKEKISATPTAAASTSPRSDTAASPPTSSTNPIGQASAPPSTASSTDIAVPSRPAPAPPKATGTY